MKYYCFLCSLRVQLVLSGLGQVLQLPHTFSFLKRFFYSIVTMLGPEEVAGKKKKAETESGEEEKC